MQNNTIITSIISPIIALIPTLILVWKSHESKKTPLAVRIIRKKLQIQKAELENKVKMEKLLLELKTLEEEAHYQERVSKFESGELLSEQKDFTKSPLRTINSSLTSNLTTKINDFSQKTSDLKQQGEQVIQKGAEQVKNTVNDLKNKGSGIFKGLTDKIKDFKDKIPSLAENKK